MLLKPHGMHICEVTIYNKKLSCKKRSPCKTSLMIVFQHHKKTGNTLALVGSGIQLVSSGHAIYVAATTGGAVAGPIGSAAGALLVFVASICYILAEE